MDITKALAPKSDQKNADDFLGGPQTFTVESVTEGTEEQPVDINLVGHPGKPYKPSKSMLRVLAKLWGTSGADWAGRSLTLYTDPTVKFGGVTLGGIKISHMSHITKREQVSLTVTRGKKGTHTVQPLQEAPAPAKQPDTTIPADVVTNTDKALADGNLDGYLSWLTENNAPTHIITYVESRKA